MAFRSESEVQAGLAAWSRGHPTRRNAAKLTFENIENKGPIQIVLTSIFERRGVTYELSPAPRRGRRSEHPDPWKHTFEFPEGDQANVGTKLTRRLEDVVIHMGCATCSDSGDMTCSGCGGDGRVDRHNGGSRQCGMCRGAGQLPCDTCEGSGALYGKPTLWSAIESVTPHRLVEADDLPNVVFIALSESPMDGEVIHRQQSATIEELKGFGRRSGGYRDTANEDPEVALVRALCRQPEIPDEVRLLRQELVLRRVDVWEIKTRELKPFWVLGDPVQVLPSTALRSLVSPILFAALCVLLFGLIIVFANSLG
ncbi:MAG: hypothetical protein AB8H86_08520 [Polyangiales bacterium]